MPKSRVYRATGSGGSGSGVTASGTATALINIDDDGTDIPIINILSTPSGAVTDGIIQAEAAGANWSAGASVAKLTSADNDCLLIIGNDGSDDVFTVDRSGNIVAEGNIQLTSGGDITSTANGNIRILPNGNGITQIGDRGPTSHSLNLNDDLFVTGKLEVDDDTYLDANLYVNGVLMPLDGGMIYGTVPAAYTLIAMVDSTQTLSTLFITTPPSTNSMVVCESADYVTDFEKTLQTNPTLYMQSANSGDVTQWISLSHDQTDGVIKTGSGDIKLDPYGGGDVILASGTLKTSSTNLSLIPSTGKYTIIGDVASTSHSLDANDDLLVTGELEVDGVSFFDGNITVGTLTSHTGAGISIVPVNGQITTIGNAGATVHSLDANDDLLVTGELEVSGNAFFDGDTTFGGAAIGLSFTNIDNSGYLAVAGNTTLSGATSIESTLSVSGKSDFGDDIVATNIDVSDYVAVGGNTTLSGALAVEGTSSLVNVISSNIDSSGYLAIAGATTLSGAASLESSLSVSGETTLNGVVDAKLTEYDFIGIEWGEDDQTNAPAATEVIDGTHASVSIRNFDSSTSEAVHFTWAVPTNMVVASGLKYRVNALVTNATGPSNEGVAFGLSSFSLADGESLNNPYGVPVTVSKTGVTASQYDVLITSWSSEVTISGVAAGELGKLKFYRDPDNGDDDYAQDVGVIGVDLKYVKNPSV